MPKCYFEVRMDCKGAFLYSPVPGHEVQASEEIVIDFYALLYCNIIGAVGNMHIFSYFHTLMEQIRAFVAKIEYVANTYFLDHTFSLLF